VDVTGIFRVQGIRINPNRRTLKNIYRNYVDIVSYIRAQKRVYVS